METKHIYTLIIVTDLNSKYIQKRGHEATRQQRHTIFLTCITNLTKACVRKP